MACRVCKRARCLYRPRKSNDTAEDLEFPPRPKPKSLTRQKGARRGWEHRAESDEAVAVNLDAHELAAWDKEKRRFKGTPEARLRAFRQWAHEHAREVLEATESESDAKLRKMIREHERARTVAVACAPPYRARTKELCAMAKNPKKKKSAKRRAAPKPPPPSVRRRRARPKKRKNAAPRQDHAAAVALFKKLHWGLPPESEKPKELHAASLKGPFAVLGDLVEIVYRTEKGTRETFDFEHGFRAKRTKLVVNGLQELVIAKTSKHGGYRVTARGIEG